MENQTEKIDVYQVRYFSEILWASLKAKQEHLLGFLRQDDLPTEAFRNISALLSEDGEDGRDVLSEQDQDDLQLADRHLVEWATTLSEKDARKAFLLYGKLATGIEKYL